MSAEAEWDWAPGKKPVLDMASCARKYDWVEEPQSSPDGERIASVVNFGEYEFGVCVNGEPWERTFDKIWGLRFTPDGRLTALVSEGGEWTLAVDDDVWPENYGFIWNPLLNEGGGHRGRDSGGHVLRHGPEW